jgi:hypothetical protein
MTLCWCRCLNNDGCLAVAAVDASLVMVMSWGMVILDLAYSFCTVAFFFVVGIVIGKENNYTTVYRRLFLQSSCSFSCDTSFL